ncbi:MAG TPA: hypothetical protein VFG24_05270 [Nitrosopumilaceae archaeon]|nr:hypothetical protein [Nitrosopumilaceae archaeon]
MNKYILLIAIFAGSAVILSIPLLSNQYANAGMIKKIQFTQTLTSSQDLGQGHDSEQMAIILSPNNRTLYSGSLTYTASEPVQIIILHQIDKADAKGQPTWTVDGNTIFAETIVDLGTNAGSYDFTGAAVGLHSTNSAAFTATVSVDGWIRGQTPEAMQHYADSSLTQSSLKLSSASIAAKIPLHLGFFNTSPVYYIITDTNDKKSATVISEKQKWKVGNSPTLSNIPKGSLGKVYIFDNGIMGNGINGFQNDVFSNTPAQDQYTPLRSAVHVIWNVANTTEILDSEKKILDANMTGKVKLNNIGIIINMPQIMWPGGQMSVREDKNLEQKPFEGGQILDINTNKLVVTFIAHRSWGPDGKTIYYIITDATTQGPAKMMGITNTPSLISLSPAFIDFFQFTNGLTGSGPFGFQPGISSASPGYDTYGPLCKISLVSWNDPTQSKLLENMKDINTKKSAGDLTIQPAKVLDTDYILDCPFIDPFQ